MVVGGQAAALASGVEASSISSSSFFADSDPFAATWSSFPSPPAAGVDI